MHVSCQEKDIKHSLKIFLDIFFEKRRSVSVVLVVPIHRAVAPSLSEETRLELSQIPGVSVKRRGAEYEVRCTADIADSIGGMLASPMLAAVPTARSIDESLLGPKLLDWQRDGALALARDESRLLWWTAGVGKSATFLAAAQLIGAKRVLFVTRAMGRNVFARDSVLLKKQQRIAILIGEAQGSDAASTAQKYAVKRANQSLERLKTLGADCLAVGSVREAWERETWALVVGWEILTVHEAALLASGFDLVVFDEAHCGKHYNSRRTVTAHRIAKAVKTVWAGTATPVPDRVRDLWAQLYAVGGAAPWSTSLRFAIRYTHAVPGQFGGWETEGPHRFGCEHCHRTSAELRQRLAWWADVRNRAAIAHLLPSVTRAMVHVQGEGKGEGERLGNGVEDAIARAAAAKMKPVAERAAEALIAGEKIVVVGNRRAWVPRIAAAIDKALPQGLRRGGRVWMRATSGEDDVSRRLQLAADFMALRVGATEYRAACLIATAESIKTSIDLHDADRVLIAALPWTPEGIDQLEGRFRRIGGPRPNLKLQIDYFIAEGTIDEAIEQTLLSKLECLGRAGAEVETEARQWLEGAQPSESEVLAGLHQWLEAQAATTERCDGAARLDVG